MSEPFYDNLPLRMNNVKVTIARQDIERAQKDRHFKQIVGKAAPKTIRIDCQNRRFTADDKTPVRTGDETQTFGHLVIRKRYYDDEDMALKKGDSIIKINDEVVNYSILEVRRESPLDGSNLLVFIPYGRAVERAST